MQCHARVAAALLGLAFVVGGAQPLIGADEKSSVEGIRKELLQLPYFGVPTRTRTIASLPRNRGSGLLPPNLTATCRPAAPLS